MGVDSLWPLLAKAGRATNPARLNGRRVAVDASIWLAPHLLTQSNNVGPRTAHLNSLFRRLAKLLFFRVRPVFVFDGARPALKEVELRRRGMQRKAQNERDAQSRIGRAAHRLLQARLASLPALDQEAITLPPPPRNTRRRAMPEEDVPEWEDLRNNRKVNSDDDDENEDDGLQVEANAGRAVAGHQPAANAGFFVDDDELEMIGGGSGQHADEIKLIDDDADDGEKREDARAMASEQAQERWAILASSAPSGVSALQLSSLLKRARPLPLKPSSTSAASASLAPVAELSGRLAAQPDTEFHYTRTPSKSGTLESPLVSRNASIADISSNNGKTSKETSVGGGGGEGDLEWEAVEAEEVPDQNKANGALEMLELELQQRADEEDEEDDWEAEAAAWEAWERAGRQTEEASDEMRPESGATAGILAQERTAAQPPPGDAEEAAQIQQAIALSLREAYSSPIPFPSPAAAASSMPSPHPIASPSPSGSSAAGSMGSVWNEFLRDCHELLCLFGVPWLSAPAEAEAQCAWLNEVGLVDAVVSDDSDTLLFGDRLLLIRHLFRRDRAPLAYASADVVATVGLSRSHLIDLALLLGSDYTSGVPGIGPVRALEILSAFPSLSAFAQWCALPELAAATHPSCTPSLLAMRAHVKLPASFPDERIRNAYIHAQVEKNPTPFVWGTPDLAALRSFAVRKLHWPPPLIDRILGPLEQTPDAQQRTLDNFVIPVPRSVAAPSQRLQNAVARLVSPDKAPPPPNSKATPSPKGIKRTRKGPKPDL